MPLLDRFLSSLPMSELYTCVLAFYNGHSLLRSFECSLLQQLQNGIGSNPGLSLLV